MESKTPGVGLVKVIMWPKLANSFKKKTKYFSASLFWRHSFEFFFLFFFPLFILFLLFQFPPFLLNSFNPTLFDCALVFSFWGLSYAANLQHSGTPWSDRWPLTRCSTSQPVICSKRKNTIKEDSLVAREKMSQKFYASSIKK